ncbi:hypothetical protein C1645_732497 [Glomus cerebriforme]|uniref:Uncharacterized protein n=1 Tax=Glomus cerebriforme TaxID=658196 RepID=A0A397TGB2_9GLOM|nr:hypothetical protein C1645_732497 [Glomus cerebriforme]
MANYDFGRCHQYLDPKNPMNGILCNVLFFVAQQIMNIYPNPKIPRGKLEKDGKMKLIRFTEDSSITDTIESSFPCLRGQNWKFFRCNSTSDLKLANEPAEGWNIEELKKISGCRKKIYIGVMSQQIQSAINFQPQNYQRETDFQQTDLYSLPVDHC